MRSSRRMDALDPMAIVRALTGCANRGAGSDAERRAANWLATQCSAVGHEVEIDTFWCRPNWALAHLWHVGLALAGSLITLASPIVGIVLLTIALVSVSADAISGTSLGRRLSPERASQNVIASTRGDTAATAPRVELVLTANYDAGRVGLAYRLRALTARPTQLIHGLTPGWLGWLSVAIVWLLAVAILRQAGHTSQVVGALQLPPTVGLLLGFALLLELATADWSPAAGDNATGVAAVLQVASALSAAPPQHLRVKVVLAGAGDAEQIGLRRHLSARRRTPRRLRPVRSRTADTVVLAVAATGNGTPYWRHGDGALLPLRYSALLRRLAAQIAEAEAHMQAHPRRGRGNAGALPARAAGLPALTIGGDPLSRSHMKTDAPDAVDPQAIERTAQFALLLIDAIDTAVGQGERRASATPA
jgi:hypothetical protein